MTKAIKVKGCQDFKANEITLPIFSCEKHGLWVYIKLQTPSIHEPTSSLLLDQPDLKHLFNLIVSTTNYSNFKHICTRKYIIKCNWKVYIDNYLDGGYHVPIAHKGLAALLDMSTYTRQAYKHWFLQACDTATTSPSTSTGTITGTNTPSRLSSSSSTSSTSGTSTPSSKSRAHYLYHYPNLMINRYGDWLDTNIVYPISPTECIVYIDWYIDTTIGYSPSYIQQAIEASDLVQQEDVHLCERVQKGLLSQCYDIGRYSPMIEQGEYFFHCLLHDDLVKRSEL